MSNVLLVTQVVKFVSGQEIVQAAFGRLLWGHFLRVRKRESVGIDIRKTMPSRLGNNLFYETLNGLFSNNVDGFFNNFNRPGKMIPSGYKPNLAWFRPFLSCKWEDLNSQTSVMIVVCKWPEMERKTLSALKNLFQMLNYHLMCFRHISWARTSSGVEWSNTTRSTWRSWIARWKSPRACSLPHRFMVGPTEDQLPFPSRNLTSQPLAGRPQEARDINFGILFRPLFRHSHPC